MIHFAAMRSLIGGAVVVIRIYVHIYSLPIDVQQIPNLNGRTEFLISF